MATEPEPDLREQINKLAIAQNEANFIGDSEHLMRDRLLADDILWVTPTGHVQTKAEYLAAVRAAFEKNPKRNVNKHDDFTVRRFGDVVIQLGRSYDHQSGHVSRTSETVHECLSQPARPVVARRSRADSDRVLTTPVLGISCHLGIAA